jgi:hypothetical protein
MASNRPAPPFPKQKQPMPGLTAKMKPVPDIAVTGGEPIL